MRFKNNDYLFLVSQMPRLRRCIFSIFNFLFFNFYFRFSLFFLFLLSIFLFLLCIFALLHFPFSIPFSGKRQGIREDAHKKVFFFSCRTTKRGGGHNPTKQKTFFLSILGHFQAITTMIPRP